MQVEAVSNSQKHTMSDEEQQVAGIEFLHVAATIPVDPGAIVYHSELAALQARK